MHSRGADAARTGCRVQVAKDRSGAAETLRVLRTTRKTAVKCRRADLQQVHNMIVAAPHEVRDRIRNLTRMRCLRTCAAWRPDTTGYRHPAVATGLSLKSLARRILDLKRRDRRTRTFHCSARQRTRPRSVQARRRGSVSAGKLLITAGEKPDRLHSEASFAMPCGACPLPASSGKTQRHRLNHRGNPQANSALHMIVVCRMHRPTNPNLRPAAHRGGAVQTRGDALHEALRGPRGLPRPHRPIPHLTNIESVQGSQYTSLAFGKRCREAGVVHSMGSVGDAYDNAMCESFFATLDELLDRSRFPTPADARREVFGFIEGFYNTRRIHSALGYESPANFERLNHAA